MGNGGDRWLISLCDVVDGSSGRSRGGSKKNSTRAAKNRKEQKDTQNEQEEKQKQKTYTNADSRGYQQVEGNRQHIVR